MNTILLIATGWLFASAVVCGVLGALANHNAAKTRRWRQAVLKNRLTTSTNDR